MKKKLIVVRKGVNVKKVAKSGLGCPSKMPTNA